MEYQFMDVKKVLLEGAGLLFLVVQMAA
jgi:hypothetical protein